MSELTDPPFDTRETGPIVGRVTQLTEDRRRVPDRSIRAEARIVTAPYRVSEQRILDEVQASMESAVRRFARAILHGSPSHREWLTEAAEAFIRGEEMPEERRPAVVPAAMPDVAAYEHAASGRPYLVERVVLGTETDALEVVYLPLYPAGLPEGVTGFARPLDMFMDNGGPDGGPRFRRMRQ